MPDRRVGPRHLEVAVVLGAIMLGIAGAITYAIAQHHELHLVGVEELRLVDRGPSALSRM